MKRSRREWRPKPRGRRSLNGVETILMVRIALRGIRANSRRVPRIAILSDIHANMHALRAVLDEIESLKIDHIACGGDTVGYGPYPSECVKQVRRAGSAAVLGNHDFYAITEKRHPGSIPAESKSFDNPVWAGIRHAVRQLDENDFVWLESLPHIMKIPGGVLTHAALHDPGSWPYLLSDGDAIPTLEMLAECQIAIAFVGHTHRQEYFLMPGEPDLEELIPGSKFQLQEGSVCAVVVGSVGQPRTHDNRAGWTIWDSDERTFEFRRTPYPYQKAAQAIQDAGLPESSALRLLGKG